HADLDLHGGDVFADLAELAIDRCIHGAEESLQRLRGDLCERDHVGERNVRLALLPQKIGNAIEMLGIGLGHGSIPVQSRSRPLAPSEARAMPPLRPARSAHSTSPIRRTLPRSWSSASAR